MVAIARRPRSWTATAVPATAVAVGLAAGATPAAGLERALSAAAPIAVFLTSAIWLAAFAERAGLAERAARALERAARERRWRLYALVCAACALLTATVSLDGAVVLMVPLVHALTRRSGDLRRPLLLGTIAVANAFSLAVPQGNPTNIIVSRRFGLSSEAFVARLFVPALLATVLVVVALALVERRTLRGRFHRVAAAGERISRDGWMAVGALVAAASTGAVAPWLGLSSWWPVCAVAAVAWLAARVAGAARPAPAVQLRVCVQVGALVALVTAIAADATLPHPIPSLVPLIAVALAAACAASALNNLPASVVLARFLGGQPLAAYAALAGLSVGALATPQGSVATMIAFDRADEEPPGIGSYVRLWGPLALTGTAVAVASLWLLASP